MAVIDVSTSRPGFGGNLDERLRPDDDAGRRQPDRAITAFVTAARRDLWLRYRGNLVRRLALHRTGCL
jgi:hypothetical protein